MKNELFTVAGGQKIKTRREGDIKAAGKKCYHNAVKFIRVYLRYTRLHRLYKDYNRNVQQKYF